jgi:uncharacterized membrane protein
MSTILLAGESWSSTTIHTKGFDSFITSTYEEGADAFLAALRAAGHDVTFQPNHVAAEGFPATAEELDAYDVIVLSDIGANTLLLSSPVFREGHSRPNRLKVLADWVEAGGSLLMVGGYLSFQGIEAKANYRATPLARVLPVEMEIGDDRQEAPEGPRPTATTDHAITRGLTDGTWPAVLGFHRLIAKEDSSVLAEVDGYPLLVVGTAGAGRTAALATDMGPHWLPTEFQNWPGFTALFQQLVGWLAQPND